MWAISSAGAYGNARIRITFNGAATPQFGGAGGMPIDVANMGGFGVTFLRRHHGTSRATGSDYYGYLRLPMPVASSLKVEIKYAASALGWLQVQYASKNRHADIDGMVLYAKPVGSTVVAQYATQTLLSVASGAVRWAGILHYMIGTSNLNFLEGDYWVTDASGTEIYRATGTEDLYHMGFYFVMGVVQGDEVGNYTKTATQVCPYRIWGDHSGPNSANGMNIYWANGDAAQAASGGQTTSDAYLLYYAP
jgi:hypothetical protein